MIFCEKEDEEVKRKVMENLLKLFTEKFPEDISTTTLAYYRNKVIEDVTQNKDPMRDIKEESFSIASELYPVFKEYATGITEDRERFTVSLRIALAGNMLEFGARDHTPDLENLGEEIHRIIKTKPVVDETDRIYEKIRNSEKILYVTDNTAELVFDKIFIEELRSYSEVYISPLSRPVQDDATVEETKKLGMDEFCKIIPRGDSIGVWFEKTTPEFQRIYGEVDFVVAKGMGCYETLVDYPEKTGGKVALLMKVKCLPVARNIGVAVGSNVVKIM